MRSAPCSGTLKPYVRSSTVAPPGGRGRTSSTYIMVSSTRVFSETAGQGGTGTGAEDFALERFLVAALAGCAGDALHCFASAISKPPLNPAPPNRLSEANRSEPVLPGRNRFWSNCIQTYRSVSGELLV